MPHIIIEYSNQSLEANTFPLMFDSLETVIADTQLFDMNNLKLRALSIDTYQVSANYQGFVHIQCRIHKGRTTEEKKKLSSALVEEIKSWSKPKTVITCEIIDLDSGSYSKTVT